MNILSKEEILRKGKNLLTELGYDPLVGLTVEMDTEAPYNGIGYTLFDNNEIETYSFYVNGIQDIQNVEFYFDGKLKAYCDFKNGLVDGELIEWNEEGIKTYWAEFEANVKKKFKKWNDQGELIDEKKEPTKEDLDKIMKIKGEK
ncbi:hypothetical protein [Pseudobacteroides cellulosolvens]|uniref:Uncharacterized protein n=1 Tax=Pseudobacteroides cellulosolvens ATCC 35603 = DSM 2933 TaxID=398512 RepID=A0A0L6JU43_9FIRM|nr:hypothetical protein [Pseudobacteroides cellulosolvens]KNY29371.1 hypothetical protein Bccel_4645 [Pseudobacteroides cellulosolvens ATCC 35603 = DSM 2933]